MKKNLFLAVTALFCSFISATGQENIVIYQDGYQLFSTDVTNIDTITFPSHSVVFNLSNGNSESFSINTIDSITFEQTSDVIQIIYNGNNVTIINPYENNGISISATDADISATAASGLSNIEYHLSGTSEDGSFVLQSDNPVIIRLNGLQLTSSTQAPIRISNNVAANIVINDTNILSDAAANSQNATLTSKGNITFSGNGFLKCTGIAKHAIASSKAIIAGTGHFNIPAAASDGFHSEGFTLDNGDIVISAMGDGIDAGGETNVINGGSINITSIADDVKGIKGDKGITINGGNIVMNVSGAASKAIGSKSHIVINGGNINLTTSGNAILETSGSGFDPSYCTAIKSDSNIIVNNGTVTIASLATANGGKGMSADNDIIINGGDITVTTAGNGAVYIDENSDTNSYTACCIKADRDVYLYKGNINTHSTGTGGKAISADGKMIIGYENTSDDSLHITAGTSGARFYVSGSTGGGPGGGGMGGEDNADYANPKALKSVGNLTLNSGTINITCTQTTDGGEGLESKDTLTINGGTTEIHTYDDCINAAVHIAINGGTTYCAASGNDGIDCNGTLSISGGMTISNGSRGAEEGFDCDNNTFAITGGTIIGTGGTTSNPTTSACTQRSIKYTGTAGNAICITNNSTGEIILMYQLPSASGSGPGGGGPGGGSNSTVMLFSSANITTGSYTLKYGGTITGGTTVNGYNIGGTYSGGSSKTFNVTSMYTTVQ